MRLQLAALNYLLQAWRPRRDSPVGSNLVRLGPLILLDEPGTFRLQPVLRKACLVRWDTVLMED